MDTLTHMALGACIGQAIGYRKFGKKSLIFGALGALIPDLDVLITPFTGEFGGWKYHRHITHSLLFAPLLGSLMGWGLWRHYGRQLGHLWPWIAIMVLSIFTHALLDISTIYGTQFLAPFSNHRFEISAVSIIDPIYTIILLAALFARSLFKDMNAPKILAITAITLSTCYIGYGLYLNNQAERIAAAQLKSQNIAYSEINAYTTIFQPFLRRIVVNEGDKLRVGFVSTFAPQPIFWGCQKQAPKEIQSAILGTEEGKIFDWFSIGNLSYAQGKSENQIIVTDARYGVPGDSLFGWWGQTYTLSNNSDGKLIATYNGKMQFDREASFHAIKNLFRAAYGLENDFMMTSDKDCS